MTMKRGTFVYRIFFLFRLHPCLNGNYFLLKKEKDTGTYDFQNLSTDCIMVL